MWLWRIVWPGPFSTPKSARASVSRQAPREGNGGPHNRPRPHAASQHSLHGLLDSLRSWAPIQHKLVRHEMHLREKGGRALVKDWTMCAPANFARIVGTRFPSIANLCLDTSLLEHASYRLFVRQWDGLTLGDVPADARLDTQHAFLVCFHRVVLPSPFHCGVPSSPCFRDGEVRGCIPPAHSGASYTNVEHTFAPLFQHLAWCILLASDSAFCANMPTCHRGEKG
ncbi:hypothetical protein LZ32DRAFT_55975 [Colletotrichum eremochloae]|nr:hypothetical protein LZ32DRAFT_55975 [Colletotrichum eremochloae]